MELSVINMMSPLTSSPLSLGNLVEEEVECKSQKEWRALQKQDSLNQHELSSYELTEMEAASTGAAWVTSRGSVYVL